MVHGSEKEVKGSQKIHIFSAVQKSPISKGLNIFVLIDFLFFATKDFSSQRGTLSKLQQRAATASERKAASIRSREREGERESRESNFPPLTFPQAVKSGRRPLFHSLLRFLSLSILSLSLSTVFYPTDHRLSSLFFSSLFLLPQIQTTTQQLCKGKAFFPFPTPFSDFSSFFREQCSIIFVEKTFLAI